MRSTARSRSRARAPSTRCDASGGPWRPSGYDCVSMARERDLFANFERMRREMDELFGDVFGSVGLTSRRTAASRPPSTSSTPTTRRARSSTPSSPGIDPDELGLEIQGRELALAGHRRPADAEGRVYQQLEIDHGPFRRTIPLGADVVAEQARATYQRRHPARRAAARRARAAHAQRADRARRRRRDVDRGAHDRRRQRRQRRARDRGRRRRGRCPTTLPVLPLRETVPFPDTLTPLAVGQERSVELVNDVLAGNRMLVMVASRAARARGARPRRALRRRRRRRHRADDQGARRHAADPRPGRPARAASTAGSREQPYLVAEVAELPDVVEESPELTALMRNVQQTFTQIVEAGALPARGAAARGRQHRRPERAQPPDRRLAAAADRGEAGAARGGRRRQAPAPARRGRSPASSRSSRSARRSRPRSSPRSTRASASSSCASSSRRSRRSSASSTSRPPRPTSCASSSPRSTLPEDVRKQADRELEPAGAPAAGRPPSTASSARYLEWIASLPWDTATEDNLDLAHAREVLDADHYDLEQVKDRILEFLAVRKPASRTRAARSSASSARPASARRRWASRSPARWAASSSASASAACATRPRSAATAAPTSARCPARSSARCATRARTTRCS